MKILVDLEMRFLLNKKSGKKMFTLNYINKEMLLKNFVKKLSRLIKNWNLLAKRLKIKSRLKKLTLLKETLKINKKALMKKKLKILNKKLKKLKPFLIKKQIKKNLLTLKLNLHFLFKKKLISLK